MIAILAAGLICFAHAGAHHTGTLSSLNLGVRYSSILQNRGVVLYRDYQIDPVVGLFLFDDKVEFVGDSLGYRDFVVKGTLRFRTRLVSLTDKPLFPATDSVKRGNPERQDTYEWNTRAELFLPGYNDGYQAEIDISYAKDLRAHHGNYLEILAKKKLFRYQTVEPNLFASVGWGDRRHNQYFYGPGANSGGLNNFAYGLWLAFPEEADRFYPIVQLTRFEVAGSKNKNGEFAIHRDEGWLFSVIATAGLLE